MHDEALRAQLAGVNFGELGLTRNQLREQVPDFPTQVYLRLPDSKRFRSFDEILDQTGWHALARAEGEFVDPLDTAPSAGATADGGPPAWGEALHTASEPIVGAPDDESITGELERPIRNSTPAQGLGMTQETPD